MKQYKDLFFDFDDTLYDTHRNSEEALREVFAYYHLERLFPRYQTFHDIYWQHNAQLWEGYARQEISFRDLTIERFRRPLAMAWTDGGMPDEAYCLDINARFLDTCARKTAVVKGAHELIRYLKSRRYRLHLCSNGPHDVQYKKLASAGFTDDFDTINLSEDIGANKPSRRYFEYVLDHTGASPDTTLMIGDNPQTDIAGAMAMGIDTLHYNPSSAACTLPQPPTFTVTSLKEIHDIL